MVVVVANPDDASLLNAKEACSPEGDRPLLFYTARMRRFECPLDGDLIAGCDWSRKQRESAIRHHSAEQHRNFGDRINAGLDQFVFQENEDL